MLSLDVSAARRPRRRRFVRNEGEEATGTPAVQVPYLDLTSRGHCSSGGAQLSITCEVESVGTTGGEMATTSGQGGYGTVSQKYTPLGCRAERDTHPTVKYMKMNGHVNEQIS